MAWNAFRREIVIYFFVIHLYSFDPTKARGCKQRDSYVYGVVVVSCYAWAVKTSRPLAIDIILSPSKKGRLVKFLWPPTSSILSDCEQFQMQMELQNFQAYRSMQDYSKSYFLIYWFISMKMDGIACQTYGVFFEDSLFGEMDLKRLF